MKRIGIFGGSFNPVHVGHCAVAEHFVEQLSLHSCYFVPTYISPFKKDEPHVADGARRLSMLTSVCRTNPRFAVSDVELRRKDVSYTVTTLEWFARRFDHSRLFLLVGEDLLPRFTQWREWERVMHMATICVARRGTQRNPEAESVMSLMRDAGREPTLLDPPAIDVSSSLIRSMCSRNESVRYLVPDSVRRIMRRHGLYQAAQASDVIRSSTTTGERA